MVEREPADQGGVDATFWDFVMNTAAADSTVMDTTLALFMRDQADDEAVTLAEQQAYDGIVAYLEVRYGLDEAQCDEALNRSENNMCITENA